MKGLSCIRFLLTLHHTITQPNSAGRMRDLLYTTSLIACGVPVGSLRWNSRSGHVADVHCTGHKGDQSPRTDCRSVSPVFIAVVSCVTGGAPGLGKSLTSVAFLHTYHAHFPGERTLLVVPSNVVFNWYARILYPTNKKGTRLSDITNVICNLQVQKGS